MVVYPRALTLPSSVVSKGGSPLSILSSLCRTDTQISLKVYVKEDCECRWCDVIDDSPSDTKFRS